MQLIKKNILFNVLYKIKNIYKFKPKKLINFNFIDRNIEIFNINFISKFFSIQNYINKSLKFS